MPYTREVEDSVFEAIRKFPVIKVIQKVDSEIDFQENPYGGADIRVPLCYGKVRVAGLLFVPDEMLQDYKCETVEKLIVEILDDNMDNAPVEAVEMLSQVPVAFNKVKVSDMVVNQIVGNCYHVSFNLVGDDWEN
jgi:hypothetical protein